MKHKRTDTPAIIAIAICVAVLIGLATRADANAPGYWVPFTSDGAPTEDVRIRHSAYISAIHENIFLLTCAIWRDGTTSIHAGILFNEDSVMLDGTYTVTSSSAPNLDGKWDVGNGRVIQKTLFIDESGIRNAPGILDATMKDIEMVGGLAIQVKSPNGTVEALSWGRGLIDDTRQQVVRKCRNETRLNTPRRQSSQSTSQYGDTPLHTAIRNGDLASIRRIVSTSNKRTLCQTNDLDQTPSALAQVLGFLDAEVVLINANAPDWKCRK